jgi:hypothetical protein
MKNSIKLFTKVLLVVLLSQPTQAQQTIAGKKTIQDKYAKKIGNLRFSKATVHFKKIFSNEVMTDTIQVMNNASYTIKLGQARTASHLKVKMEADSLLPDSATNIIIYYDAAKRNDFGMVVERIMITTTDSLVKNKLINVSASIEPYFAPMTAEDSSLAPRATLLDTLLNYGEVKQGDSIYAKVRVINTGKRPLQIHTAKTSSGTVTSKIENRLVAPGDTTAVNLLLRTASIIGDDTKKVVIYCNDPYRPKPEFLLRGKTIAIKRDDH